MFRLSAGGRFAAIRRSTPPTCVRLRKRLVSTSARLAGTALVLTIASLPVLAAGGDALTTQDQTQDQTQDHTQGAGISEGTIPQTIISFVAPPVPLAGSAMVGDRDTEGRSAAQDAHWTLRAPVYVRTSAGEPARPVAGQAKREPKWREADVAMFSWKEIAAIGLVLAFLLGALLAITGGGAQGPSQRPFKDS